MGYEITPQVVIFWGVLETTTLSPWAAPGTVHLIVCEPWGVRKFFLHDAYITFASIRSSTGARSSNPYDPVGPLGGTLVTVSLSSSSVGSGTSSSIVSSSSGSSFIVGSSSVPISGCVVNFKTSVILCPFGYSLKIRLTTRWSVKGDTSPYLMIRFVE
jgi:hypothetical protein